MHIQREIFDNDQGFPDEYSSSLSLLDKQLMSIGQSFQIYRSFWLILPKQICKSDEISASKNRTCWTGNLLSLDNR